MGIKKYKIICGLVAVIMSANTSIVLAARNTDAIQNQIDKNKEAMDEIERQRDDVNKEKSEHQNKLNEILEKIGTEGEELASIQKEVDKYQEDINSIQLQIDESTNAIKSIEDEVASKKELIKQKEQEEKEAEEKLGQRIRNYYKIDISTQYIYMIIKSESLSSLFNNIQSVFRIMNMDKKLITEAKEIKEQLVAENKALDEKVAKIKEEKEVIVAKQNELKDKQSVFLAKQKEQQGKVDELAALENEKSAVIASLSDKDKELASKGKDLLTNNAQLEAQLQEILNNVNNNNNNSNNNNSGSGNSGNNNSGGNTGGGGSSSSEEGFLRPGSGVVTDPFGHRINPVTGRDEFHKGVDFGDPEGAPVHAAKSGTVVYSGNGMSGYGNAVIIDHGNGVQTLYAHNSALLVSVGQRVSRGEVIARVGSTGQVTGPHIHWEIRVNGQPTDPMGYV